MEAARSTEGFSRRITVSDANNIVTVLDLNQANSEYQIFAENYIVKFQVALEDIKATVGLFSLAPAPFPDVNALMSESAKQAEIAKVLTNGQKIGLGLYMAKGNGPWDYKGRVVLQNQGGDENHVPIMVPFLSTNETLLVGGDFKFGVKIEPIWNQPLKANDYIVIMGTYRQVVSFTSKKKDDDLEALSDRLSALETLLGLFGAATPEQAGTNGLVKGAAAGQQNWLLRGDRAWQDPASFVSSVANQVVAGLKQFAQTLVGNQSIRSKGSDSLANASSENQAGLFATGIGGGGYWFLSAAQAPVGQKIVDCGLTSSGNMLLRRLGDNYSSVTANVYQVDGAGNLQLFGFTHVGGNVALKIQYVTGVVPAPISQGQAVVYNLPLGVDSGKVIGWWPAIHFDSNGKMPPSLLKVLAGFEYEAYLDENVCAFRLTATNSAALHNKPCSCLFFYIA